LDGGPKGPPRSKRYPIGDSCTMRSRQIVSGQGEEQQGDRFAVQCRCLRRLYRLMSLSLRGRLSSAFAAYPPSLR